MPRKPEIFAVAVAALFAVLPGACALSQPEATSSALPVPALRGEVFAETYCSACHAIGRSGASPHLEARPFRELSKLYPVRSLEEALAEGIVVGHPDMPPFQLDPDQINDLIEYIEAIQDPV